MLDTHPRGAVRLRRQPGRAGRPTGRCSATSTSTGARSSSSASTTSSAIWTGEAPYDLEGEHWTHLDRADDDARDRPGRDGPALPAAAPADRRDGRRAVLAERRQGRAAAAGASSRPTSCCPQWVRTHWETYAAARGDGPAADPVRVARGEDDARRRRRAHRARVRLRAAQPLPPLLRPARLQARPRRPRQPLQVRSRRCPTRRSRPTRSSTSSSSPGPRTRSSRSCSRSARRSATSARCSTAGSTGSTPASRAARWS